MKPAVKQSYIALLMLLMSLLVLPMAAMAQDSGGGQAGAGGFVRTDVYGGSGDSIGGSVYGGGGGTVGGGVSGCKKLEAGSPDEWKKLLNPSVSPGKVTFIIAPGYCDTEFSLTSYSYPEGVVPKPDSKPYEKEAVYQNATATFGPGTHSLQVELPCGYYRLDFYNGPANAKLDAGYGPPSNLLVDWLVNSTANTCSSGSDASSGSGLDDSGSSGSIGGFSSVTPPAVVIEGYDYLDVKALCSEQKGKYRFQLSNRNQTDLSIHYMLTNQSVWTQMLLPAGGTKLIEIVSGQEAPLRLEINGVQKVAARASMDMCSSDSGSSSSDSSSAGAGSTNGGSYSGSSSGSSSSTGSSTNVNASGGGSSAGSTNGSTSGPGRTGGTNGSGTATLDNTQIPAGAAELPGPVQAVSGNDSGTMSGSAQIASETESLNNEPVALGYATLPQTGEGFPWSWYTAGALLVTLGLTFALRTRRNG
ncbi:LPXTG cell wall anchor domain-containing protein [Paenibacillus filicis]|uniref:LPXTG cell wall anchor domain-containing protein n=1 Tax=Paenibacillus gyeongsangnamensis TaxID=3388067 RepID=A0ABT4QHI9_9BACL|nr:LPXTG cell wall anchor domain-containing protein [Paenibacillus filicis]MCZ8516357.1 LPXTG cell wall anchor domain-containing protein [Paenibacillus filicis]